MVKNNVSSIYHNYQAITEQALCLTSLSWAILDLGRTRLIKYNG